MSHRYMPLMACLVLLALVVAVPAAQAADAENPPAITVYKTPTCGCCGKWIDHLEASGFRVDTRVLDDLGPVKSAHKVPLRLASCHTALVDGYVVEGHVPADVIKRLLAERPPIAGIAVPGMPIGSPGMEMGNQRDRYQVISFDGDGRMAVYAER